MTELPPLPPAPPPPPQEGMVQTVINAVKGMSFTNALVIAVLVIVAIPAYAIWEALNDPVILNKFTSNFEEIASENNPCTVRIYSKRGAGSTYSISTGFAFQGNDRWVVAVHMDRKPREDELESYCATLQQIVDFMRRPNAPSPTYPNSDETLIWQYPLEKSP
jgi:hypothetical protein